ncbi:unnamed protein product [Polarella glacialis]|uniref:Uncharacterized protein n=1 Tax=Polarella glacialis TaxID=89957 RepID=A0A813G1A3_POLGL|nr:unnamed protein product [Polarella glacialis]
MDELPASLPAALQNSLPAQALPFVPYQPGEEVQVQQPPKLDRQMQLRQMQQQRQIQLEALQKQPCLLAHHAAILKQREMLLGGQSAPAFQQSQLPKLFQQPLPQAFQTPQMPQMPQQPQPLPPSLPSSSSRSGPTSVSFAGPPAKPRLPENFPADTEPKVELCLSSFSDLVTEGSSDGSEMIDKVKAFLADVGNVLGSNRAGKHAFSVKLARHPWFAENGYEVRFKPSAGIIEVHLSAAGRQMLSGMAMKRKADSMGSRY